MNEVEALKKVAEFHKVFGLKIAASPDIQDSQVNTLRLNLLKEELKELDEALEEGDIVKVADALADLQYVLSGAILSLGFGGVFQKVFDEVHSSNMTKACFNYHHAVETKEESQAAFPMLQFGIENNGGKFIVRREDGKVIKSKFYRPARIEEVLETNERS